MLSMARRPGRPGKSCTRNKWRQKQCCIDMACWRYMLPSDYWCTPTTDRTKRRKGFDCVSWSSAVPESSQCSGSEEHIRRNTHPVVLRRTSHVQADVLRQCMAHNATDRGRDDPPDDHSLEHTGWAHGRRVVGTGRRRRGEEEQVHRSQPRPRRGIWRIIVPGLGSWSSLVIFIGVGFRRPIESRGNVPRCDETKQKRGYLAYRGQHR